MRISDWSSDVCSSDLSPEYTADDHAAGASVGATLVQLLPGLTRLDYRDVTRLDCPIFLVAGRRDFQTPAQIAAAWFGKLRAPAKSLFWVEHSAQLMPQIGRASCGDRVGQSV